MSIQPFGTPAKGTIKLLQDTLLFKQLRYLKQNSPYYSQLFIREHIDISKIGSVEELVKLPTTTKEQLHTYNEDFICIKKSKIIDYVTTSGTLGKPVTFALSEKDLKRLAINESQSLKNAGITKNDIIQITTTLDRCFIAGIAYYLGAKKLKAGMIRVGSGMPELQWETIFRIRPTVIICVPSFLLKILEYADHNGIKYGDCTIKKVICIGEPIRNQDFSLNAIGGRIKQKWDVEMYSTYASTEMSTSFTECNEGCGGHLQPELIVTELLNDNGIPVKDGEIGELTVTTLGVETMPLLRFQTGDLCMIHHEPCKCGRTSSRLGPIMGRKNQMIKYKGTTFYPASLSNILYSISGIQGFVVELFKNEYGLDDVQIHLNTHDGADIQQKLNEIIQANLRVMIPFKICTEEEVNKLKFAGSFRKALDFIDNRGA